MYAKNAVRPAAAAKGTRAHAADKLARGDSSTTVFAATPITRAMRGNHHGPTSVPAITKVKKRLTAEIPAKLTVTRPNQVRVCVRLSLCVLT